MSLISAAASVLPDPIFVRLIALAHRRFEPELDVVVGAYPKGGMAIDVGTWYGPWSRALAKRASRVICFEPNPDVAAVLARTLPANVELVQAAASDSDGTATLSLPAGGRGTEGRASLEGVEGGERTVTVPTRRLDDVVAQMEATDIRFVKVDVEGHELAALRGAAGTLSTYHPVLAVEVEERHGGVAPVVDFLASLGYSGSILLGRNWKALTEFDLARHQREFETTATGGYLQMAMRKGERYVNNVVFTHPQSTWSPTR